MKTTKIAVIGTGTVGSTIAYACLMRNIASEIMLVDIDTQSCRGQLLDLSDALSFSSTTKIIQVTYQEAAQADIIIISAGKAQTKGQSRQELLETNKLVIADIAKNLAPLNPGAIIIMVTNPVDTLTRYAQQLFKIPATQIIGSGTMLDSQRLRYFISQKIAIAEESIHISIIGQHGDLQVAALSSAHIAGIALEQFISLPELQYMAQQAKDKVYEIIECKGRTCYGVASCVTALCEDIIFDQNRVAPVSCYIEQYGICMSMPAALGAVGIKQILYPPLNTNEQKQLEFSIASLKNDLEKLHESHNRN